MAPGGISGIPAMPAAAGGAAAPVPGGEMRRAGAEAGAVPADVNRWRSQYAGGHGAGYSAGSTARADTPGGAGSAVATVFGPGVTEAAGIAELVERVIECQVGFGTLPVVAHSGPGDLRDGLGKLTHGLWNLTQGLQQSAERPGDGAGDTGDQCGDLCRGAVQVRSGAFVLSGERPR
jgi:hypothetical protein